MLRRVLPLVILSCIGLTSPGCAVMMRGSGHEGGSGALSDAALLARPDSASKTRRKIPPPDVGYTTPSHAEERATGEPGFTARTEPGPPSDANTAGPVAASTHRPLLASLVAGGGALGGADYDGFSTAGLSLGGYPQPRLRVDCTGTINRVRFTGEGLLGQAFTHSGELNLDLSLRYYLTRDHTLLGLYLLAGIGMGALFWDYAKPVTVVENGARKTLTDDRINYYSLYGGAGISLLQTRYVHVGGNLIGGTRLYGDHTGSGLQNNLLKTTGFVRAMIEVSFRVGGS